MTIQRTVRPFGEVKDHFDQVIEDAVTKGAQVITKEGKPDVIVLALHEYEMMEKQRARKPSFVEALMQCPGHEIFDLIEEYKDHGPDRETRLFEEDKQ